MGKHKLIVDIGGRLGNNLFQIANGYTYATRHNLDMYIHIFEERQRQYYESYERFHFFPEYRGDIIGLQSVQEDEDFIYHDLPFYENQDLRMRGSFESERYFDGSLINDLYKIPTDIEETIRKFIPDIDEYVGISIRRGDFLLYNDIFMNPVGEWYTDCYHKYFEGRKALIFSDDIGWCVQNIKDPHFQYFDNRNFSLKYHVMANPEINLYTMGLCHDHICSNSTWSWWGARICEKQDSVNIFPDKRFTYTFHCDYSNYIPERWIKETATYENDRLEQTL